MRNNKGYTLVELLVTLAVFAIIMAEIGNMMMNSSRLYRNGTYEVGLQTEAQQIVQQMEEFLIDVNHSVSTNYDVSVSSDIITISNNDAIYTFQLENMDADRGYGMLYYYRQSLSGGASSNHVLMAEYVQSISLNMAAYTSDVVTLNVSMNNGRYGYQASQDIYLRNSVGSGGGGGGNHVNSNFNEELDVLRYKEYHLDNLFKTDDGEEITFEWDTSIPNNESAAVLKYTLLNDVLYATPQLNHQVGAEIGPYVLLGKDSHGTVRFTIKVSSQAISNGPTVILQQTYSSYTTMTPAIVKGINIAADEITSIEIEAVYRQNDSDDFVRQPLSTDGSPNNVQVEYSPAGAPPGGRVILEIQNICFNENENDNSMEVSSTRLSRNQVSLPINANDAYNYYIEHVGKPLYYEMTVKYNGGIENNNGQTLTMQMYLYGAPSGDINVMSDDAATRFWSAVGM